jgi:hypothetical protein
MLPVINSISDFAHETHETNENVFLGLGSFRVFRVFRGQIKFIFYNRQPELFGSF